MARNILADVRNVRLGASIIVGMTSTTYAQHSFVPAIKSGTDEIVPLNSETFLPQSIFTRGLLDSGQGLAPNAYRATGPNVFPRDNTETFSDGFEGLSGNSRLTVTIPTLSHTSFSSSGRILYWDGTGDAVFGQAPAFTTLTMSHQGADADDGFQDFTSPFEPLLASAGSEAGDAVTFEPWNTIGLAEWDDSKESRTLSANGTRVFDSSGHSHSHIWYDLRGDETSADNVIPDGIYLFGQVVGSYEDGPGGELGAKLGESAVVYAILNKGQDANTVGKAIAAVAAVPEPSVLALLAISGAAVLLGRRRGARSRA